MNKLASILALTFALVLGAKGQSIIVDVPNTTSWDLIGTNYAFTVNTTNTAPVTNLVVDASASLYHTFQFYSTSNAFQCFLDKSLGSNVWSTNAVISLAANQVFETNLVQKVYYFRIRSFGSNTQGGVNYVGGR